MKTPVLVEISDADASAFPTNGGVDFPGLTKREYFAAMALQGLIGTSEEQLVYKPAVISRLAVQYADALLEELAESAQ